MRRTYINFRRCKRVGAQERVTARGNASRRPRESLNIHQHVTVDPHEFRSGSAKFEKNKIIKDIIITMSKRKMNFNHCGKKTKLIKNKPQLEETENIISSSIRFLTGPSQNALDTRHSAL